MPRVVQYAMDASNCKSMLENVKIHVRPPITAELFVSDDTICRGDPVEFTVHASGGKPPYIYRLNDTIVTIPHVAHPPTTFNYLLVVSDSCGSPTGTDTDTVNVRELPAVNFTPDTTRGCPPLQIQFNLETSEFNCQKYWEFGDPGSLNSSTSTNPYHIFQNPGTYTVQVTITDQYGCVNSRKRENLITAYPNPTADFDLSPEVASITDPEITFTNFSQGHDFCFWNFGDNSEISNDCNPIHIYEEPGNYQIMLQVSTIYNCWDSIVYDSIPILDQFTFYIPTAFTPDDNDLNDVFRPFIRRGYDENTDHSKDFHFYIFDRWGLEIFETNDILEPWDGRVYGKEYARPGVYQWYIFYMDKEGNRHEECGSVTVIR
ncbi:MAG: PKD domain-containing protein [Bacteroidia bacterium]|nr:PKD domain-containing protein [Bacteroidia bacterium]